nr:hypothetical protein [Tanacetum cinerariifolium]
GRIAEIDADENLFLIDETAQDQGMMNEEDLFGVHDLSGDEVIMDVTAGENVEQDETVAEKEVSTADDEVVTTADDVEKFSDTTEMDNTHRRKFNRFSFLKTPKVLLLAWVRVFEIEDAFGNKQYKLKDVQELIRKLFNDVQNIQEELAEDEHLHTISAIESDEVIKSSVEDLVPIPNEFEGIPDNTCDVPFCDNSLPLDILKDQFEDFFDSNDDSTSIDDNSFSIDEIDYVEASPPHSELVSLGEVIEQLTARSSTDLKMAKTVIIQTLDQLPVYQTLGPLTLEEAKLQMQEIKRLIELKAEKEKYKKQLKRLLTPEQRKAQEEELVSYQVKRAKMIKEYKYYITFRDDPLPITKFSYRVNNSIKEDTMRITRNNQPLNLKIYDKFVLKNLGFTEWLELHALASKVQTKSNDRNLALPEGVVEKTGLVIREPEAGIFLYNGNFNMVF